MSLLTGFPSWGPAPDAYWKAILALSPGGAWRMNEAAGSTTLADSSGNGVTLTLSGYALPGATGICPNQSSKTSVEFFGTNQTLVANALQGSATPALAATFDNSTGTSMSFAITVDASVSGVAFPIGKANGANGWYFIMNGTTWQFVCAGQSYTVDAPDVKVGPTSIMVSIDYTITTNAVNILVDGVLTTKTRTGGTTGLSQPAIKFFVGGRSDGFSARGRMQAAAFWPATALSVATMQSLFLLHNRADRSAALSLIYDNDMGTSDVGDYIATAVAILYHMRGQVNLLGCVATATDNHAAPAVRQQLNYYGLSTVPVAAYQGTPGAITAAGTFSGATMTLASPCVVTAPGGVTTITANMIVTFYTTGALYTGLLAGTQYYVVGASISGQTFQVSATSGGTAINTSGSQSGTHSINVPTSAAGKIHAQFAPTDVRANYTDSTTFYGAFLANAPNNSVVVYVGGSLISVATFLNASGANVTLWNQKVKAIGIAAGQWPNSSSGATPPGNFLNTGEYNLSTLAQSGVDFVSLSTTPLVYWSGIETDGNTGNTPALGNFIQTTSPAYWTSSTTNVLGYPSGITRTSWDQTGLVNVIEQLLRGAGNIYYSATQITTPVIQGPGGNAGANASAAGSTVHRYLVPALGSFTLAQWRTWQAAFMSQELPPNSNTCTG